MEDDVDDVDPASAHVVLVFAEGLAHRHFGGSGNFLGLVDEIDEVFEVDRVTIRLVEALKALACTFGVVIGEQKSWPVLLNIKEETED